VGESACKESKPENTISTERVIAAGDDAFSLAAMYQIPCMADGVAA
jgi:hypothetical protein